MDRLAGRFENDAWVVEQAQGAWMRDKHGRRMLDYLLGNCTQTLGHCHPRLVEKLQAQSSKVINVGDHYIEETRLLADRICRIAKKDMLRFVNSGSEACHLAIRLARAYTGKRIIVKFDGHYHGWFGEELKRFIPEVPYSGGLDPVPEIISVSWNCRESVTRLFEEYSGNIAAVICEPILCHAGVVPPDEGFLPFLRTITRSNAALLIFDECITGFRVALGGGQEFTGVESDLVIYAKALSQGVPLAVCAGTAEVMNLLCEGIAYQGATYDAHPLGIAAATETLNIFDDEKTHEKLVASGIAIVKELTSVFSQLGIPVLCQGVPGAFQFFFTDHKKLRSYHEVFTYSNVQYFKTLVDALRLQGINVGRADIRRGFGSSWMGQWFYSSAHGTAELEFTVSALRRALTSLPHSHGIIKEVA